MRFLAVMALIVSCSALPAWGAKPAGKDLRGPTTPAALYAAFPIFRDNAAAYQPQAKVIAALRRIDRPTRIVVFFGTWCLDSRSEVPTLLKTLDVTANSRLTLELDAVDRLKDDGIGLADRFDIDSVPVFIFIRDGRELGRITVFPRTTMEEEMLAIIATHR
ncbi:hypothetical protein GURASL_08040 [Geotalea uraniireducens]|uniref:Thioredoxin n=1 Tax=Geotalea uraniireducens TaxID=351604 RepID=A0ABN6VNP3_9BACT|nr:thioredoxin family protein [Geotalea uraniireducens]BDV41881.1 hypothetical protein GURASL_08040 [Geotalea uraniireducens]